MTSHLFTSAKQSAATPSTAAVTTSDGTVFTLAASEYGFIQNCDTDPVLVKLGASASTTSFHYVLAACTAQDDGKGGVLKIDDHIGAVSIAASTGSPRVMAWKKVVG